MKPELPDLIPTIEPPLPMAAEVEKGTISTSDNSITQNAADAEEIGQWKPDPRLWAIVGSLAFLNMVGGLENTITVVALPIIVADIEGGSDYVWVSDIQFVTGAAILPFLGQLANIFGRRYCTLGIVLIYTLGSGLCAGAQNMSMLLAGRAIQGAGTQGTLMMTEIIIADLVPVRWRASYTSIIMAIGGLASLAGPSLGGVICQYTTWRWVFYLNLPITGVALVLLFIFLRVKWNRDETIMAKLERIDWIGNFLVLASSIIILLALIWAGVVYPWNSAQVLAPLILGLLGMVGFVAYEAFAPIKEPILPVRILRSPTPILLFIMTFFFHMGLYYTSFYMTIYYQGVLAKTPAWAALLMLPVSLIAVPAIVIITAIVGKTGRYKWFQVAGFALTALGLGVMSLLEPGDSAAKYICVQIPAGLAVAGLIGTLLPAFQGCAPEKDQATVTAGWTWMRSFSMVWGVAIAGTIFNQYIIKYAGTIEDENVQQMFKDGNAFSLATKDFVDSYQDLVRAQILWVLDWAFQKIFQIGVAWAGVGLVAALLAKEVHMRSALETEYGLEEYNKTEPSRLPVSNRV